MSEPRKSLGLGALVLLPLACCAALPLILAAGLSAALLAWVGGLAAGVIALGVVVALPVVRARGVDRLPSRSPRQGGALLDR